jgi:hypothetical protein
VFLHLETAQRQVAWLHASATEWKNTFSMEIYGKDGKLRSRVSVAATAPRS